MRTAVIIATLVLAAPLVHAETFAFADPSRIDTESTEWNRLWSEVQTDKATKDREINAAIDAARGAKPADAQGLSDKARKLAKMDQDDLVAHEKTVRAAFEKHRGEVAAQLEREKKVTLLLAVTAAPKPGRDLTDEMIKRLNASDGQALAEENARLKAENAALTKPIAPSVPLPPPVQPLASKGKK